MNIFNYESKFNQLVMTVADLIILNLLYIICCIPLFTIGAAQAGLFTGIRVLLDPEDDSSVAKAFFRGFSNGFGRITVVNVILLVLLAVLGFMLANILVLMFANAASFSKLSLVICIIAMSLLYIIHTVSGPFHATFGCTVAQLFRNSLFMLMAYPLRCLASAVLVLLPLAVLMIWPQFFLGGIIAVCALYYSVAYLMIFNLMKKPFKRLKDSFYAAQNAANECTEA